MTPFKKTILFLHRWLGFITGLVVFIVSITGCLFCFQDEIQDAFYKYRSVEPQQKAYIAPSVLKQKALALYPDGTSNYTYYYGKDRPAGVMVNSKKAGFLIVFFNPYTGEQTHVEDYAKNFFVIVEYIHLYLLLPPKIGAMIVGVSVLIFVAIMITGLVLWWPKRKSDRKRSFSIKWGAKWKRVNYDLHNVLGFYATAIAIILAITGVSMTFDWVREGIYKAGNLGKTYAAEKEVMKSDSLLKGKGVKYNVADVALPYAQQHTPDAKMFLVYTDDAASGTVGITAYNKSMHFAYSDEYSFDKYTGKLIKFLPDTKKSLGLRLNDMNYDIHVGQIAGLTGKILAFLASLICASLPITGFIIWLGKRKKPKKTRQVKHAVDRRAKHAV
ncbi:PepSY-associated TM helix domain-containing protein [Mucilaginibacter agri]|uniref:PepSY domain-containing protein n=1 Tax=Mucilaginibacter agri TaxID=2695265 RepID=A0A965ZIF8_9SPHI|nr:PepSY-associated TM helix domain-containing protein [Mucilaginibacter agri]NCD70291.1 PepSY domain-containing protein [Mucilaginibacter agri]